MKSCLILLYFLLIVGCFNSTKESKIQKLLSFNDLIEIFNSNLETKDEILLSKDFKLIRNDKNLNIRDYSKSDTLCRSEGIFIENQMSIVYYLNSSKYRNHYESIKKEIENHGFLFMTTKRKDNGNFVELYVDTTNNKMGLMFSILPPLSVENDCDAEGYRIRIAKIK